MDIPQDLSDTRRATWLGRWRDALRTHKIILLILAVSVVLRTVAVLQGGQRFHPDETRYYRSALMLNYLARGEFRKAIEVVTASPDHTGFIVVGLAPAAVQAVVKTVSGLSYADTAWAGALVLSLASVACILLTYLLAKQAGACEREGTLAAMLMAGSATVFYWSRHLVPYDVSIAAALYALWLGMRPGFSWQRSAGCGLLCALAALSYYGYWYLVAVVGVLHLSYHSRNPAEVLKRAVPLGLGALILPAFMFLVFAIFPQRDAALDTTSLAAGLTKFSAWSAKWGGLEESWRLVWKYLWYSDHFLLVLWAVGFAAIVLSWARSRGRVPKRAILWLGTFVCIYLLFVLLSLGLHKLAIYGRSVKQLVPFGCLAAAVGLYPLFQRLRSRPVVWMCGGLLLLQAAWNLWPLLSQKWPDRLRAEVSRQYGDVSYAKTVLVHGGTAVPIPVTTRYVLLNAQHFDHVTGEVPAPAGKVLLRYRHPAEYLPVQYEVASPQERAFLRTHDISMRLIDTQPGAQFTSP